MIEQIKSKIILIEKKIEGLEIGSVERNLYNEVKQSLMDRLDEEVLKNSSNQNQNRALHVDVDTTCESCQ